MSSQPTRLVVVALLALAGAPADAPAATVSFVSGRLVVRAAPGEANRVFLERDEFGFAILDGGPNPVAGAGCNPNTGGNGDTVSCDVPGGRRVGARIDLGDGDDRLQVNFIGGGHATALDVVCGPGEDTYQPDDLTRFPRVRTGDCERVQLSPALAIGSSLSSFGPRGVSLSFSALAGPTTARVDARFRGRRVARGTISVTRSGGTVERIAPTRAARRLGRRVGDLTIVLRRGGRLAPVGVRLAVPTS
jgi:hypothetical protein